MVKRAKRFLQKQPTTVRTVIAFILPIVLVALVMLALTSFALRAYTVSGDSMMPTLQQGDQLLVNKIGRTWSGLWQQAFIPRRGSLVVFKNPLYRVGNPEEHVVKRVVALPGERVVVKDGRVTVFNSDNPKGFNPDDDIAGPQRPTSGNVDRLIPEGELFVAGDNRLDLHSFDSRNGMSTIPAREIEGVVFLRILPLTKWQWF